MSKSKWIFLMLLSFVMFFAHPAFGDYRDDWITGNIEQEFKGNAIYQQGNWYNPYNHAALYDGNGKVIQVGGIWSDVVTDTELIGTFKTEAIYFGSHSILGITLSQREKIIQMANIFVANTDIEYSLLWGQLKPYGDTWDVDLDNLSSTVADIEKLRCDGLVEVCYEVGAGLEVWGKDRTNYFIHQHLEEHNNSPIVVPNPETMVCPVVQRGAFGITYTKLRASEATNHKITASHGSNGSIDPEGDVYVDEGDDITFNATPDSGYVVDRWYVDGQDVGGMTPSILIQNIQTDRTVRVTFKPQSDPDSETKTLTSVADSYTAESDPSGNRGTRTQLGITGASIGTRQYGFVKFNISSVPSGSTITGVELKLYSYWHWNPDNADTWVGAIGQSWSETGVTWNNQPNAMSGLSIFKQFSSDGYHTWSSSSYPDLKSLVQAWVDGTKSNYGFFLTREQGYQGDTAYRTREWGTSSQRPKLIVTYIPLPPSDLIITNLYPDPSPVNNTFYVGQSVDWYVTVKNNDSGPADSSSVGYYLGTSETDLSNRINSEPIDALNEDISDTAHDFYTFIASDVGQKFLICKADYKSDIEESNEDNNTRVYGPFNVAEKVAEKVATPSISPNGGTFTSSTQVTLSCSPSDATIRYTTNGSTPTSSSTQYTGAFTVSNSCTVKTRGFKSGYTDSDVASANFTINPTPKVATPSISPNGGTFTSSQQVELFCSTSDAEIRYTTNETTPTSSSTLYTGAFTINSSCTVKTRGFKDGYTDSDVASASFTITSEEIPELSVIPDSRTVPANSGTTTFTVNNTGSGTMPWTASVISGESWLSITSGSGGTNSGTITAAFSANTSGFSRTGTIRVTASGASGSPKDVIVVQSSQDNGFASGWRYTRADIAGSSNYPWGSTELTENALQEKFSINNAYGTVLTGDVTGNDHPELIYVSGDQLKIYDGTGSLLHSVTLGSSNCSVSMLEDINGDGVLDIGIGTGSTSDLKTYFYDGDGNLLKTLSKSAGYDCSMKPSGLTAP